MADEHRRVEPRGVVGSGMLTDPERIEQLEHERERLERTWRDAPKRRFGEVLSEAPARPSRDEDEEPPGGRGRRGNDDTSSDVAAKPDEQAASTSAPASVDGLEDNDDQPLPRVPPDPRMARLHAMLNERGPAGGRGGRRS